MRKSEVIEFRKVLETNVIELDRSARRREAILVEHTADEFDRVLRAAERDLAARSLEAGTSKLREVRAALARMQDGSYGTCLECEEPISRQRLAAIPWAPLCIRCQEAADCRCGAYALAA